MITRAISFTSSSGCSAVTFTSAAVMFRSLPSRRACLPRMPAEKSSFGRILSDSRRFITCSFRAAACRPIIIRIAASHYKLDRHGVRVPHVKTDYRDASPVIDRADDCAGPQPVQRVRPRLHHLPAFGKPMCLVVRRLRIVALRMCQLQLDHVRRVPRSLSSVLAMLRKPCPVCSSLL